MSLMLSFALQAAASAPAAPVLNVDFDLADVRPTEWSIGSMAQRCDRQGPGDIVVCGRRSSEGAYPYAEMARLFEPRRIVAETQIGRGMTGRAFVESVTLGDGAVSQRVMVGIRVPF